MKNKRSKQASPERTNEILPSPNLYWVIAIVGSVASIRLLLWLLANAGVFSEEDANLITLASLPIALFTIRFLVPRSR